jgi:ATP-dependent helicase/nuclease subunit A
MTGPVQEPLFDADGAATVEERPWGPSGHPFTDEQLTAIRARRGSRLLYANAGSGKTAVIVERFVRAVLEDDIPPGRILAITFTDKAAGELRQRLRTRFLDLDEREAARAAEAAWVSTIHGFCARLLRARPLAAGLDPGFRVLDEAEARRLRGDSFAAALAAFLDAAAETDPAALELAAAYRPDRLARLVETTYSRLRSRGETRPQLPPLAPPLFPPDARERLERARVALAARLSAAAGTNERVDCALTALERCGVVLAAAGDGLPTPAELATCAFKPGNAGALRVPECAEYLEALKAFECAVADGLAAEAVPLLGDLLVRFGNEYGARKRERSGLDFDDLELCARDLLRDNPAVRAGYAGRFDLIMVDEFQDTNARQLELLLLLERDNLLTVGDEFQSIYGFRHADVSIFRRRREDLEEAGRTASLAANFRSRGPVLDVLNAAFAPELGEGFVPLEDGREDARELAAPLVELLVTTQDGWDEDQFGDTLPPTKAWRKAEARLLACRIRQLVGEGARPGDVAVLVRAYGDLAVYQRAIEDTGLSTYVAGAGGYWSAQPVRDLLAFLSALANPRDELRMFELLASPLVGLDSDGLALLARGRRTLGRDAWWALEQAFCPGGDGSDGLAGDLPVAAAATLGEFCPWFAAMRAAAPRLGLADLVERAVTDRRYDLDVLSWRGGTRRLANLRKLARLAREYEAHEGRDLRGFLDWIAVKEDAEVAESEAPVESEGLGAVRLMSIHGAKGLEFPIVCLADTGRQGPWEQPDLHVGDDGRIGLRLASMEGESTKALDYASLQEDAAHQADAEERRVFYVACTRVQERLIVSGSIPRADRWPSTRTNAPPISWLGPALAPGVESALSAEHPRWTSPASGVPCLLNTPETLGDVLPRTALAPVRPPAADGQVPAPEGPPPEPPERPIPLPVRSISYTGLEDYARCGYRFYLGRVLRLPDAEPPPGLPDAEPPGISALLRGTLAHLLLERLDFAHPAPPDPEAVAAEIGVTLSEAESADLASLVAGFAAGALCRRLAATGRMRREAAFAFPLVTPRGEVTVNGVVDVMGEEDGRRLVVDYKSDHVEADEDLDARTRRDYEVQRLIYAVAALRDGAGEVEVVHCFLERPDDPVSGVFSAAEMEQLEARLSELAAGVLERDFPVTVEPHRNLCATCPGRAALCSWGPEMTLRDPPEPR